MSIADKLTAVAENMPKVYEAGQQAEYDRFWDTFQNYGNRRNYNQAFYSADGSNSGWNDETFKPKYPIVSGAYPQNAVFLYGRMTRIEVDLDFSQATSHSNLFNSCSVLKYIKKLSLSSTGVVTNTFLLCRELEDVEFAGEFGGTGLDLSYSTKLSKESILSLFGCLKNYGVSGSNSLTLGTENLAKLTDAEKAIATEKGWTLA